MNPDNVFFTWSAEDRRGHGSRGVTDRPNRAAEGLNKALHDLAPGAKGVIRETRLERHPRTHDYCYRYGQVLVRASRGEAPDDIQLVRTCNLPNHVTSAEERS